MLAERISDTRAFYADVFAKTSPYDGNRTEYAIRVFFKYLADEFDVAHSAHVFRFLYNLGITILSPI